MKNSLPEPKLDVSKNRFRAKRGMVCVRCCPEIVLMDESDLCKLVNIPVPLTREVW